MYFKQLSKAFIAVAAMAVASPAQAALIAGWDFSQWALPGALTIDNATGTRTLNANYSDLNTEGQDGVVGPAETVPGTLFIDGTFGGYVAPANFQGNFVPNTTDLTANVDLPGGPLQFGTNASFNLLTTDDQLFTNFMAMAAKEALSVDFQAFGVLSDLFLDFDAKSNSAGSTTIEVLLSTDGGASFAPVTTVNVGINQAANNVVLGGGTVVDPIVRLSFAEPGVSTIVDNVGISGTVPEPGTLALLGAGVFGLGLIGRRRS